MNDGNRPGEGFLSAESPDSMEVLPAEDEVDMGEVCGPESSEEGEVEFVRISEKEAGRRLDAVLTEKLGGMTRSHIQKLIAEGHVRSDQLQRASKNYKVKNGDLFRIEIPAPRILDVLPENIPLDILFEDEYLLIVNKPRGMVVHPAPGNYTGTLVNALMYHCKDALSSINGVIRPGIVHRIDKDTSGLLVVAKTDEAHSGLAGQFAVHSIERVYCAIVHNNIRQDSGTIEGNIGRSPKDRRKMAVLSSDRGKSAVTHFLVTARSGKYTCVECRLETGRTHQIRVHMANTGHPVLGDPLYGPAKNPFGIRGQILHARDLGFLHPVSGRPLFFSSPLPDHCMKALRQTGMEEEYNSRRAERPDLNNNQ